MATRFRARKLGILEQLNAPDSDYHDLSPKGTVDEPIRALIHDINNVEGLVTTSSCSGRISVFLEGRRVDSSCAEQHQDSTVAGPGGKGGGGSWLFISHEMVHAPETMGENYFLSTFNLKGGKEKEEATSLNISLDISTRYIHLKFEPMILHVLTASLEDAQRVLTAALSGGFRESGAVSLNPTKLGELNPMVAVRSTGYSFDAVIGYQRDSGENVALVDEVYLRTLISIANERFNTNSERIRRFRDALLELYTQPSSKTSTDLGTEWEDAKTRRHRKREEGLARQRALKEERQEKNAMGGSSI